MGFFRKVAYYIQNEYLSKTVRHNVEELVSQKIVNADEVMPSFSNPRASQKIITVRFKAGYSLQCQPLDLSAIVENCLTDDYQKQPQLTIHPGDIVFDLGGNIGSFAVPAALKGATVYSFEPDRRNLEFLSRNVEINNLQSKIRIVPKAVYSHTGEVKFHLSPDNLGGHFVLKDHSNDLAQLTVGSTTLADFCASEGIDSIDLLKLDVEGSEYEIFKSLSAEFYKHVRNIVGEYHLDFRSPQSFAAIKKYLKPHYRTVRRYAPYYFYATNN